MPSVRSLLLLIAFAVAGSVRADNEAPVSGDRLEQVVPMLIEQLSSASRRERLEAEQQLTDIGPALLPHLPDPGTLGKASQREAVRRLRVTLELAQARDSLSPTMVNFREPISVEAAVKKLGEAVGRRIRLEAAEELTQRAVKFSGSPQTFWSAVTRLETEFDLRTTVSDDNVLTLTASHRPERVLWSGESQSARMTLVEISTKELDGDREQLLLRLTWTIEFEPRFLPLYLKFRYDAGRLTFGDGMELAPFTPGATVEIPLSQSLGPARLQTDYVLPRNRLGTDIEATLEFDALVATGAETFRFNSIAERGDQSIRHAGAVVSLRPQRRQGNSWRIPLQIVYDTGGPAFESHRNWFLQNRAELHCDDTEFLPKGPPELRRQVDGAFELEYEFDNVPGDVTDGDLSYRLPTLITDMPILVKEARFKAVPTRRRDTP